MSENTSPKSIIEEFDIRIYLRTILKRWKILLILTLVGGIIGTALFLMNQSTYKASATVFVNSATTPYLITPQFLVQSEEVKTIVLQQTGLSEKQFPEMDFNVEKTDKNIITIVAISKDPNLAVKVVNAWADATLTYSQNVDNLIQSDADKAMAELETLDLEFSDFLLKSGLQDLSWIEMLAITGSADTSNIAILESSRPLPIVPLAKRNEIKKFVREINLAQWKYYDLSKQAIAKEYETNRNAYVLNHAEKAENDTNLLNKITIPLGAFLGFFIAIFYILIANWWKDNK